jgi:broad specificity phosphatase PhoE
MHKLILVKHASPRIDPAVPSPRWVLSDAGRERCAWLAQELSQHGVRRLFSSLEPKALETAALAGVALGLPVDPRPDLHENDRTGFGFGTDDVLKAAIRGFFDRPSEIVMGRESADAAFVRFAAAVSSAVTDAGGRDLAIVTHGTVLTLFVSRHNAVAPFDFWESLRLPSYVVLDVARFAFDGQVRNFVAGSP